jgi:uncharacterized protein (DUF934 family)
MTANVIVTDDGFSKEDWHSPIISNFDVPRSKEALAIDVMPNCDPVDILKTSNLKMIRINFSDFSDGRGFTLARIIRLLGFTGRLCAKGLLISDKYSMVRPSGFDEVEITAALAKKQPEEHWLYRADGWQDNDYQNRMRTS